MSATDHSRRVKRLERLLCTGLRAPDDLEAYAMELKGLVREVADEELVDRKIRLLKAVAHETRLKILLLLSEREMCVCELTVALEGTQPTVSHHLKILDNVGLIKTRKEGKWVFYSIADSDFAHHLFDLLEIPQ